MRISTRFMTAVLAVATVAMVAGSAGAATVLWVDNEAPHSSWQTLIESGGHTFTRFDTSTYNLSLNNQASIDYVNSFDVIVISGSNPNFNAVRGAGATWNAQPTPMINLGNYLISGQFNAASWRWTTPGNGGTPNSSAIDDVLDEADPIWTNITLTPGTPPTVSLVTANVGILTLGSNTFLPDITTVATKTGAPGSISLARAAAGALRAGGAEQYFIAGMTGGTGNPVAYNAAGQQVFLNAITTLTDGWEVIPTGTLIILK